MPDLTPEERANTPCYIARTTTTDKHNPVVGIITAAIVDDGSMPSMVAKEVAKWISAGMTIDRAPA